MFLSPKRKSKDRQRRLGETSDREESGHESSGHHSEVKKKKRKIMNPHTAYMGIDVDLQETPKKKKHNLQDFFFPLSQRKNTGNTSIKEHTDLEIDQTPSKKKKKKKSHQECDESLVEDVSASVSLQQETAEERKSHKSRKSKTAGDLTPVAGTGGFEVIALSANSFSESAYVEGTPRRKKKNKLKTHDDGSQMEDSLTEDPSTSDVHNAGHKKRPQKDNPQTTESSSEFDVNAGKYVKKEKKKKAFETFMEVTSENRTEGTELETDDGMEMPVKKNKSSKNKKTLETSMVATSENFLEGTELETDDGTEMPVKKKKSSKSKKTLETSMLATSENFMKGTELETDDGTEMPAFKKKSSKNKKALKTCILATSENFMEGTELETDDGTEMPVKKKKSSKNKKALEKSMVETSENFLEGTELETDDDTEMPVKKKSSKNKKALETSMVATSENFMEGTELETDDGTDMRAFKKKSSKNKKALETSMVATSENFLEGVELETDDGTEMPVKKKKSSKNKKALEKSMVATSENFLEGTELKTDDGTEMPVKKKKSSKNKKALEKSMVATSENFLEGTELKTDDGTEMPVKKNKSSKSKKTLETSMLATSENFMEGTELETDDGTDMRAFKKKSSKNKKALETSMVATSENFLEGVELETDDGTEMPVKKKKSSKNKKALEESMVETSENFLEGVELETDDGTEMPVKKKKSSKNKNVLETSMVATSENFMEGTELETDDGTEMPVKKSQKKKKAERNADLTDGHEETAEPEQFATRTDGNSETDQTPTEPTNNMEELDEKPNVKDNGKDDSISPKPRRRSVRTSRSVRDRDIALLQEFFPKINSLKKSSVRTLINDELERVKEAKENGFKFGTGRFGSSEDDQIKKNVEEFLALTGVESGEMLFHSYRFPEERDTIERLKRKYHFRYRLAEGIYRTLQEVSNRGGKLYDDSGTKGRFTDEETKKLKKYWNLHGNNWTKIGSLIGRNNVAAQLKASQLRQEVNRGNWSVEETNRLILAVKEFVLESIKKQGKGSTEEPEFISKDKLYKGIPWVQMEKEVQTRNWTHCKTKWFDLLLLRMNDGVSPFEKSLGIESNIKIIKWLHECGTKESWQVNWEELANALGNVPPAITQKKVYRLKLNYVPSWQSLGFPEIVNFLHTETLPVLEANLAGIKTKKKYCLKSPEKKDKFLVSDIFQEYTGSEKKSANFQKLLRSQR